MSSRKLLAAFIISLVVLVASTILADASANQQQEIPKIRLGTAILIGVMYYGSLSPWFANLGFTVFYRPLVAGTLVGLVMGYPAEGVAIGANINILYLGWIGAGGTLPSDPALAGYLGTALALAGGLDVQSSLALAAPLGLLGGVTFSLRMSLSSIVPHWADQFAEEGDIRKVALSNFIYTQPFLLILYGLPVAIAAYLGAPVISAGLNWIAQNALWVMNGLFAASGMLAALGIAMNLRYLLLPSVYPYYFLGFVISSLLAGSVNLLVMAIIGAVLAFMHVRTTRSEDPEKTNPPAETRASLGILTRRDVFSSWLRWLFFSHASWNWERLQGLGFAHAMTPIIRKLYHTKDDIRAALKRHLVFFNTQPDIGGVVHGIVISMEEERASGAEISDEAINGTKVGLMGPMSGVGDTIQQGIVIPIGLAIGMGIAIGGNVEGITRGNILGPIVYLLIIATFVWGVGWLLWWQGYKRGRSLVLSVLSGGFMKNWIAGAQVLGNFIMGALTVSFVTINTGVVFRIGGADFDIQNILDQILPNLLPLAFVLISWWLLAKRKVSPIVLLGAYIAAGILLSYPLFPGIDPTTNEVIRVGFFR